jgi:hypothetical protein
MALVGFVAVLGASACAPLYNYREHGTVAEPSHACWYLQCYGHRAVKQWSYGNDAIHAISPDGDGPVSGCSSVVGKAQQPTMPWHPLPAEVYALVEQNAGDGAAREFEAGRRSCSVPC